MINFKFGTFSLSRQSKILWIGRIIIARIIMAAEKTKEQFEESFNIKAVKTKDIHNPSFTLG